MRAPLLVAALLMLAPLVVAPPPPAQAAEQGAQPLAPFSRDEAHWLRRTYDAAEQGDWKEARYAARQVKDDTANLMAQWMRLRVEHQAGFFEITRWLEARPHWPGARKIQRIGEEAAPEGGKHAEILRFFKGREPITARGARLYAEALIAMGRADQAKAVLGRAWVEIDMAATERKLYLGRHGAMIKHLHNTRMDRLLWERRYSEARAMMRRVSPGFRKLAEARIALAKSSPGVDGLIKRVPQALKDHPGLAYERMRWRIAKGRREGAEEMMLSRSAATLGRPDKWADERRLFAREAFEAGDHRRAFRLAAPHGLNKGGDFAELEWFAGWRALRKLNDPAEAFKRFESLWNGVSYPVSKARAAYWAGEALERMGRHDAARSWRLRAADFPNAYYGQLAAVKLGLAPTARLSARTARANASARAPDAQMARVGLAFLAAGDARLASAFLAQAAKTSQDPAFMRAVALAAHKQGAPNISVRIGKEAARAGLLLPETLYPLIKMPAPNCGGLEVPEPALALAIARQESELKPQARSHAGAEGLMQVMPRTAKLVAAQIGLGYDRKRLSNDALYNARLGICYLAQMLERFDGSYILAAAAYNAGPSRVKEWIRRFGDPTQPHVDKVDWVESIPFGETRNYVQRVLENLHMYRARLNPPTPRIAQPVLRRHVLRRNARR